MRKSSTCAKASTAHVRRSRRSRSAFPRRGAPASRCRGRNRPARRLPARKAQAAGAPAPASPPRVNAPPPSVPAPSAPVLPRAPCAGKGAGRLPSARCRHRASARHPSEARHRGQRPRRRQRVRRVRVGVLRRQRRLLGRGSGLSSDGTDLSAIAPWLAGIYPLPCCRRGGGTSLQASGYTLKLVPLGLVVNSALSSGEREPSGGAFIPAAPPPTHSTPPPLPHRH